MIRARAIALVLSLGGCLNQAEEAEPTGGEAELASHTRPSRGDETARRFRLMGRNTIWTQVGVVEPQSWTTFHTQGLVKIGDVFFVSAVEIIEPTVRNGVQTDALYDFSIDRSEGRGRGWLRKFDADGRLLGEVEIDDGSIYHPGGIDFDGRHIWVPVAEYRPNSRSNVYRVDPDTLEAKLAFRVDDHIGGIVHDARRDSFHGVSWGSRRFYTWRDGRRGAREHDRPDWVPNPETTIDYQDCHLRGDRQMLCGGVAGYATPTGPIAFGGLDLVDLGGDRPAYQVPVNLFVDEGAGPNPNLALTHNAFWAEPSGAAALRFYFMTETDNQADLLVYEATPWVNR
jgi:hypothetical protein